MVIKFECPYCQNRFTVEDGLAGRDGWCRICKRWVVVPSESGKGSPMTNMTFEQKCVRLEQMLQYAANKADNLKQLLSKYSDGNGNLVPAEAALFRRDKRASLEKRLRVARGMITRLQNASTEALRQRDDMQAKTDELGLQIETIKTELRSSQARIDRLSAELDRRDEAQRPFTSEDAVEAIGQKYEALLDEKRNIEEERNRLRAALEAARRVTEPQYALDEDLGTALGRGGVAKLVPNGGATHSTPGIRAYDSEVTSLLTNVEVQEEAGEDPVLDSYLRFLSAEENNVEEVDEDS